ncbi:MAG: DUF6088 family protein [Candidatus Obscuribacterales bacterium]
MSTTARIRDFIKKLDRDAVFTTRDLLTFGTRSSVDNAVYNLVKGQEMVRIIPGVFSLPGSKRKLSLKELAIIKAKSFGHRIIKHASEIASGLGLASLEIPDDEVWFATSGSKSAFKFGSIKIRFKPTCARKMKLGDTRAGQVIRALNYIGESKVTDRTVAIATVDLSARTRRRFRSLASMMPAWLSEFFLDPMQTSYHRGYEPSVVREDSILYFIPSCRLLLRDAAPRAPSISCRGDRGRTWLPDHRTRRRLVPSEG